MEKRPKVLEKFALNLLSNFDVEDLRYAARKNIDLRDLLVQSLPPLLIRTIRLAASMLKSKELLNPDNVLKWLDLTRPEMAATIRETQLNYLWYKRQLKNIKNLFLG